MRVDLFLAQLYAMRAQIDAMIGVVQEDGISSSPEEEACTHPEEYRVNTSTLRGPRTFVCRRCGKELEGPAAS